MGAIGTGATVAITIKAIDGFSSVFDKVTGKITGLKLALAAVTLGTSAAITGFGGLGSSAINAATKAESAFTGVRKTVELTEREFEKLEKTIRSMSMEIPVSFEDLSKIGEIAGQLGVSGVKDLEKFIRTIADISVTTNMTAETAATAFARIANVMNEPLKNVDRMGAVIVELGNNFATTEQEITNFAERIAGTANIAGFTTDQVFAIATAFSSVGIQAEAGGTAVQKVLININEAVSTSNDKLALFAETAGMSAEQFQEVWEKDAGDAFAQFVEGLGEAGDDAFRILDELELKDQRLIRSFLSLAQNSDLLTDALKKGNNEWSKNEALISEAEKRYGTTESAMQTLKNTWDDFLVTLGDLLLPEFKNLIQVLKDDFMPILKEVTPQIGEFLTDAIKDMALMVKENIPEIRDFIEKLIEWGKQIFELVIPAMKDLMPLLLEFGGDILESLAGILKDDVIPNIKDWIEYLRTDGKKEIKEFIDKIMDLIEELHERLIPNLIEMAEWFVDHVMPAISDTTDQIRIFIDKLSDTEIKIGIVAAALIGAGGLVTALTGVGGLLGALSALGGGSIAGAGASMSIIGAMGPLGAVLLGLGGIALAVWNIKTAIGMLDFSMFDKKAPEPWTDPNTGIIHLSGKPNITTGTSTQSTTGTSTKTTTQQTNYTPTTTVDTSIGQIDVPEGSVVIDPGLGGNVGNQTSWDVSGQTRRDLGVSQWEEETASRSVNAMYEHVKDIVAKLPGVGWGFSFNWDSGESSFRKLGTDERYSLAEVKQKYNVSDFILTSDGKLIQPHSDDTIIGTKNGMGNVSVYIERIYGTDPDEISEAFERKLRTLVR